MTKNSDKKDTTRSKKLYLFIIYMNYPHPQVSGNNLINVFQKNQKESEKKLMMTSLTAVDLFVWHESLGGGGRRPGLMSSSNLLLSGDPRLLVLVLSWGESFSSHCLEAPF